MEKYESKIMEFIMTYGWAIILFLIIIAVFGHQRYITIERCEYFTAGVKVDYTFDEDGYLNTTIYKGGKCIGWTTVKVLKGYDLPKQIIIENPEHEFINVGE